MARKDFADKLHVHINTIGKLERGETLPDAAQLMRIAELGEHSVQWLVTGRDARMSASDEFVLVDMLDVKASAGGGSLNGDHDVIGQFAFRKAWLRSKGIAADHSKIIRARGDSMADKINDGDILLVNTAARTMQQDGIYVIELDGLDYVKLLQRDFATGGLQIISYNQAYKPQHLPPEKAAELRISGHVVWHGGEL
ncbi:MAG: helix-turn-helix transcriptional regulator [Ramlibacter sp.]|nr:helix-turn-helix transcriptional regulator [Ramlibacter sp.]